MFTGIITDVGRVRSVRSSAATRALVIETAYDTAGIEIGASIACSGACLTVVETGPGSFAVDASAETLSKTTLGAGARAGGQPGARARLGDELGGHLVSGHVDATAEVVERAPRGRQPALRVRGAEAAGAVHRLQGLGRPRRRLADRQRSRGRGRRQPVLRRQHHPPHRETTTFGGAAAAGRARQPGNRHAGALRSAPACRRRPRERWQTAGRALARDLQRGRSASPIEEVIEEARNGRMFILVDDEDRENEGDLVIPAQMATPEAINFMAKHGRGLICLALTGERVARAAPAADAAAQRSRHRHRLHGLHRGARGRHHRHLRAGPRAHDRGGHRPQQGPDDIVTPGHIFPAARARRRRAGAHRPHRGGGRPRALAGLNPSPA